MPEITNISDTRKNIRINKLNKLLPHSPCNICSIFYCFLSVTHKIKNWSHLTEIFCTVHMSGNYVFVVKLTMLTILCMCECVRVYLKLPVIVLQ